MATDFLSDVNKKPNPDTAFTLSIFLLKIRHRFDNTIDVSEILRACGGRFISIMHSNDYLSNHLYFTQLLVLNDNNDVHGVYCKYLHVDLSENKLQKVLPNDGLSLYGMMIRTEAAYKLLKNENSSSIDSFESLLESFGRNLSLILLPISFYRKLVY